MSVYQKGKSSNYHSAWLRFDIAPAVVVILLSLLFASAITAGLKRPTLVDPRLASIEGGL